MNRNGLNIPKNVLEGRIALRSYRFFFFFDDQQTWSDFKVALLIEPLGCPFFGI